MFPTNNIERLVMNALPIIWHTFTTPATWTLAGKCLLLPEC